MPVRSRQKDTARRPRAGVDSACSITKEALSSGGGEERTEGGRQTSGTSLASL